MPYSFDGTAALNERPSAVVFPQTTEQVVRCVQLAGTHGTPIVTRGSGTGLSGGSVPSPGCVVLCLTQMDAILAVDPRNLTLRAQPGAITQRIDDAAARHGLSILRTPVHFASALSAATSRRIPAGFAASSTASRATM